MKGATCAPGTPSSHPSSMRLGSCCLFQNPTSCPPVKSPPPNVGTGGWCPSSGRKLMSSHSATMANSPGTPSPRYLVPQPQRRLVYFLPLSIFFQLHG